MTDEKYMELVSRGRAWLWVMGVDAGDYDDVISSAITRLLANPDWDVDKGWKTALQHAAINHHEQERYQSVEADWWNEQAVDGHERAFECREILVQASNFLTEDQVILLMYFMDANFVAKDAAESCGMEASNFRHKLKDIRDRLCYEFMLDVPKVSKGIPQPYVEKTSDWHFNYQTVELMEYKTYIEFFDREDTFYQVPRNLPRKGNA